MPIRGVGQGALANIEGPLKATTSSDVDFSYSLAGVFSDASKAEQHADQVALEFASGNPDVGIHETIIAAERANVHIRYAVTLKNKLLEAYRELMNTSI